MFSRSRLSIRGLKLPDSSTESSVDVVITKANILALFATPKVLVPAPGAGKLLELVDAFLFYKRAVATYTGGGVVTIAYAGGIDVTDNIAVANSFGAASDKIMRFSKLDPTGGLAIPANTALVLKNITAAFTDPGTAAGTAHVKVRYRIIPTTGI